MKYWLESQMVHRDKHVLYGMAQWHCVGYGISTSSKSLEQHCIELK